MKILLSETNSHILVKDNNEEICVNKGSTIQYTGIYYKIINDIVSVVEIETTFIGMVVEHKFRIETGILGIYVKPLYIWNKMKDGWNKIVNYKPPDTKYFYYPHLLALPNDDLNHYHGLNFLHTCVPKNLEELHSITQGFYLDMI